MPTLYNGIGAYYYGRRNLYERTDGCAECGKVGKIVSYDTTMYFVVFLIPIFPLGEKRIIDQCPRCTKHKVLPLAKWREMRTESLTKGLHEFERNPRDLQVASELIGACMFFHDHQTLKRLGPVIGPNFAGHAECLTNLAAAYMFFGDNEEAEGCLRAAIQAQDAVETRYLLAENLIAQLKLDEARPLLMPILERREVVNFGNLAALVQGYQAAGRHADALALIADIRQAFPSTVKDKWLKGREKASLKGRKTGKKIKMEGVAGANVRLHAGGGASSLVPRIIMILALAGIFAAWAIPTFRMAGARKIYLVNGLDHPYTVKIAGREAKIPAHRHVELEIPEGDWKVEVAREAGQPPIEPFNVTLKLPTMTRVFLNRTHVINPDATAPILFEKVSYYADGHEPRDGEDSSESSIHLGKTFYQWSGVDYAFTDPPERISMQGKREVRERVGLLDEISPGGRGLILRLIQQEAGAQTFATTLKRVVALDPGASLELDYLMSVIPPEEAVAFLSEGLDVRPMRLKWHRDYQDAMRRTGGAERVRKEYEDRLAAAPETPELKYLLARLLDEPARQSQLFAEACSAENPVAYGCMALGIELMRAANFADALDPIRKAASLDPKERLFRDLYEEVLLANEAYAEYADLISAERSPVGIRIMREAVALGLAGREAEIQGMIEARARMLKVPGEFQREYVSDLFEGTKAKRAYAEGDKRKFIELCNPSEDSGDYECWITRGDIRNATRFLDEQGIDPANEVALNLETTLYLATVLAGRSDTANARFDKYLQSLPAEGLQESRGFAALFAGARPISPDTLLDTHGDGEFRAACLATLAFRFPEARDLCLDEARKFNYSPFFPKLLVKEILDAPPPSASSPVAAEGEKMTPPGE